MKTSDAFFDAFSDDGGNTSICCDFCHRCHFNDDAEAAETHRMRAKDEPDKYVDHGDCGIGFGYLEGKVLVWQCPCDAGHRYEVFIWKHRRQIIAYLKARITENKETADEEAEWMRDL